MHVSKLSLSILAAFSTASNALPLLDSARDVLVKHLPKRAIGPGVYYCNDPDFQTDCFWLDVGSSSNDWCVSLVGTPWYKLISSFGPDKGVTCSIFSGDNCDGNSLDNIVYPGFSESYSNHWDNQTASFKCLTS